ncbi:hypothetical protein AC578_6579 [Pseudocercospora eumusae]|uniref:Uncharacterized protein n=1 Tax=Pseudocercospora eumusae TaxID=321146 RepID=A0A139HHM1_9PEZI|nr:hypothetical protein AC578_6579 [Pseudocercospora eumusae]
MTRHKTLVRGTPTSAWPNELREQHRLFSKATPSQGAVTAMRPNDTHSEAMIESLQKATGGKPGMPVDELPLPNTIGENDIKSPPRSPRKARNGKKSGKKKLRRAK